MTSLKVWVAGEPVTADDLNENFSKIIAVQSYTAGEAITAGNSVYINPTDQKVYKADGDNETHVSNWIGFAVTTAALNASVDVQTVGKVTGLSGLTAGSIYYPSSTAGAISTTLAGYSREVGIALSTTTLLIFPRTSTRTPVNVGDGSDGDVTVAGEETLTRDMYYNNLTVNGTLNTANWRIFVKGTINGSGTIQMNGANGDSGGNGSDVGSSGTSGGGAGGSAVVGYFTNNAGGAGGNGINQSSGGSGISTSAIYASMGTSGGVGGNGGTHSGNTGGVGTTSGGSAGSIGTINPTTVKFGILGAFSLAGIDIGLAAGQSIITSVEVENGGGENDFAPHSHTVQLGSVLSIQKITSGSGGSGGGAGGGSNASNHDQTGGAGGGGGASGGVVFIVANIWAGTFTIKATGGNGGNGGSGSSAFNSSAGGGGGGGGSGGISVVFYYRKTWTGSYVLTGGTAGTGGAEGGQGGSTAAGSNGSNGTAGSSYEYPIPALM